MPTKKKIQIVAIGTIALVVGGAAVLYAQKHRAPSAETATSAEESRGVNSVDYAAPQTAKDETVQSAKEQAAHSHDSTDASDHHATSALAATITAATQDGDTVLVRATAEGTTAGTCQLKLSLGDHTITRTANLAAQGNYVICQGFNIPLAEFPSAGSWKAVVTIEGNGTVATAEKEVGIQK